MIEDVKERQQQSDNETTMQIGQLQDKMEAIQKQQDANMEEIKRALSKEIESNSTMLKEIHNKLV